MIQSYATIPLLALFIYTLLFCMFFAAKKNRLLRSFMILMFFLMMWAVGAFLMRIQFLGNIRIWYHLSLCSVWIACIPIDMFLCQFNEKKIHISEKIMYVLIVGVLVANIFTEWFLAPPVVKQVEEGVYRFVYEDITVGSYIMYGLLFCFGIALMVRAFSFVTSSTATRAQFIPLAMGMTIMLLGNALILIPAFAGIPLDIVTGVIFAMCIVFALYYKRLFSLTLAFSRRTYTIVTAVILILLVTQFVRPVDTWLRSKNESIAANSIVIVAVMAAAVAAIIYVLVQKISENVFLGDYNSHSETLKVFHNTISKSLKTEEICKLYCDQIIGNIAGVDTVRVCETTEEGSVVIAGSSQMLETGRVLFKQGSAVIAWLKKHRDILTPNEFARSVEYRAMWEDEKLVVNSLKADYFVPMFDNDQLLGATIISMHDSRKMLHADDIDYLSSMNTLTAVSLKNSKLYQKALNDAQTDDLTGLLNRKYFIEILNKTYEENPRGIMSLMILNLDDFKLYNQLYGVREGDLALKKVADILRATVGCQNYVARYSGKEFAILMPGQESSAAGRLADNLRRQIYDLNRLSEDGSDPMKILTTSIGICSMPFGASTVKQLLNNVDLAVFQVKQHGKNGVMIYSVGRVGASEEPQKIDHKNVYSNYANTIYALSAAIDAKDHYTFTHSKNVAYYAEQLAMALGLNEDTVEIIREGALLHDVGKIGIPEAVLNKPGRLTGEEYEIIKKHPENAVAIIRHLPSLDYVIPAVLGHHERWDGKGYPRRLGGEDIPLSARILCVADCFDAITSKRCYQEGRSVENALNILESNAGSQFDPTLVEIFNKKVREGVIVLQYTPNPVS